jgi:hypothetical protein
MRWIRHDPGLPDLGATLVAHLNSEVHAVAAAILDVTAQRVLATDPSALVRVNLASRASELIPEVIATLRPDDHPDVKQALAASTMNGQLAALCFAWCILMRVPPTPLPIFLQMSHPDRQSIAILQLMGSPLAVLQVVLP